jgi:hypothetical protein
VAKFDQETFNKLWNMQLKLNEKLHLFAHDMASISIFRNFALNTIYLLFELVEKFEIEQMDKESNKCTDF